MTLEQVNLESLTLVLQDLQRRVAELEKTVNGPPDYTKDMWRLQAASASKPQPSSVGNSNVPLTSETKSEP